MTDTSNTPTSAPQPQASEPAASATAPVPPAPAAPASAAPANPAPTAPMGASAAGAVPPMGAAPANPVPPAGQVPPAQPFVQPGAPVQNMPGMPLFSLTGGMKFGWAALGFLMGPVAILIAWLTNAHNFPDAKSDAIKFSLFGFLAQFVVGILIVVIFGMAACAAIGSMGSYYYSYY